MPKPNVIDVCRAALFTKEEEMLQCYPYVIVEKVLRVREMYNWFIAKPDHGLIKCIENNVQKPTLEAQCFKCSRDCFG